METKNPVNEFNLEIDMAASAALQSAKGGDENWNEVMNKYSVQPLSEDEKNYLLSSELKITRGAFPVELRRVFEKIVEKYRTKYPPTEDLIKTINSFDIDSGIKNYYSKIKPFSGLGDIFKNASIGTQKFSSGLQGEKHKTITCKNCGAPRLDEMQYDKCLFCGGSIFEIKN